MVVVVQVVVVVIVIIIEAGWHHHHIDAAGGGGGCMSTCEQVLASVHTLCHMSLLSSHLWYMHVYVQMPLLHLRACVHECE